MPSPYNPNNRQDFLREQEHAVNAAREMQRRATLPVPPRQQQYQQPQQGQFQPPPPPPPQFQQPQYQYAPSPPPPPPRRSEGIHHPCPGQQARHNASYGRTQPPIRRQYAPPKPPPVPPPPPPPPKQTKANPSAGAAQPMGSIEDILRMFSGLGGGFGGGKNASADAAQPDAPPQAAEGMDSLLIMVMLLLLRQENADQGLLLALMYIMM